MPKSQEIKTAEFSELLPPAGSESVGIRVIELLNEILEYRESIGFGKRCSRFYQLRRNKHWKSKTKSGVKLLSANLLGAHHQRTVNMLTDNNPTFNAVPCGPIGENAEERLSVITNAADHWWNETEQQHQFEKAVHIGELYGTVGEFLFYDEKLDYPDGDVNTEVLDPLYYSLYPKKCDSVEKAEAFIRWYSMSVREAKRKWKNPDIKSDTSLLEDIGDERDDDEAGRSSSIKTFINSTLQWLTNSKPTGGDDDELFIVEAWVKDHSEANGTPVYPGGIRRVITCNAGTIVLDDVGNPNVNPKMPPEAQKNNYLFNRFPVSHNQSVTDPSSPFGMADFEQLEQLQIELNKSLSQFGQFKDKVSRPKLMNPKDSGITNDELNNSHEGVINPNNHIVAQAIRFIDSPQMPVDVATSLNLYKDFFNEVSGTFSDVMQGQKHGSEVVAAKAIAMLLEQASRMARGKIRNYSKMLRERGRMYLALAQMWYGADKYIEYQRDGKKEITPVNREMLNIPAKISVVNGSTMPVSNIQKREEALMLFKAGVIDQEELLKRMEWDNYKDVIRRMQRGPMGKFLQKLGMTGVPKELLGLFEKIGRMDEKEIERGMKDGKIPPFAQILSKMVQAKSKQPAQPDPEMLKADIEAAKAKAEIQETAAKAKKADAEAEKVLADIQLLVQKIETEITNRQLSIQEGEIRMAGLELDKENIRIQKAQAIAAIKDRGEARKESNARVATDIAEKVVSDERQRQDRMRQDKGGYDERGMTSNNEVPA